jgi:type IV pilus assembly protein PilV
MSFANRSNNRGSKRGRQGGTSLIEVLIATVVLSLGVLGVAGMQAAGLRASYGASYRAQAAFLAQDILDRMRGNPGQAKSYGVAYGDAAPTGTTIIDRDKAQWLGAVRNLPAGDGTVQIDLLTNVVTVTVRWDNSRAGGSTSEVFTLSSRIWSI